MNVDTSTDSVHVSADFLFPSVASLLNWKWFVFLLVFLVACGESNEGDILVEVTEPIPTLAATAVPVTIPPTNTDSPPTETPSPTATETQTTTATPLPSPTSIPSPTPIDRTCPVESPVKPDYQSNYLAPEPWPMPDPVLTDAHFWLVKPLLDQQPLALNTVYPYGSDSNGRYLLHNGIDSLADKGVDVLAAGAGTVVYAGEDADVLYGWRCDWYGNLVVIEHDDLWLGQPVYSLYGHVLDVSVETGQRVEAGDRVAEVGFGGVATHPHLHFEVRVGSNDFGATRNPLLWLAPETDRGVIVGRLVDEEKRPWQGTRVTLIDGSGEEVEFIDTWTYLDDPEHLINPDEGYAENFVFGDLATGNYELFVKIQGVEYRQSVEVKDGELSFIDIVTEQLNSNMNVFIRNDIEEVALLLKQGETSIELGFDGSIFIDKGDDIETLTSDPQMVLELIENLEELGKDYKTDPSKSDDLTESMFQEDIVYFANLHGDKYLANLDDSENDIVSGIPAMLYEIDAFLRDSRVDPNLE